MKALIVDDNDENLYLLQAMLTAHGFDVMKARNGIEALDLLHRQRAGLIVSDILMPEMDGFQLCREVRADQNLRGIPFIFYTATYTTGEDEKFALGLGADRFVLKPADPKDFMTLVAELLASVGSGAAADLKGMGDGEYFHGYSARLKGKLDDKMVQVRQGERRYRDLFNSLRDVVVLCDLDGLVVDANQPALRNTFGYELEELKGRRLAVLCQAGGDILPPGAGAQRAVCEAKLRRKDGSLFDGEISPVEMIGDDGTRVGNIGVIRDVSQHRMLEAQLLQAQKMEAIGRLAGGVAHDFNNKLTVILGYVELLKRKKPGWEATEEMLDQVLAAACHARDLTRQLLAFSRKEVISPRLVDLNRLIQTACRNLGQLIGEDIALSFALAPDLWGTRLDPTQVDQILMNLAVNSRDAMPQGGSLRFETRNVTVGERYRTEHPEQAPGDYVQLRVTDTGCGMGPEVVQQIFEPFFTTKEAGRGTGLGLSTIYGIVTQNRGFVEVNSEPGRGTCFTIYFPRCLQEEEPSAKAVTARGGAVSGAILLVEDDDGVREVTREMLETLGYRVFEKSNAADAVSFCLGGGEKIDLIISDVILPGMGAREMMQRIEDGRPGVPVLYMSGYSLEKTGLPAGGDGGASLLRKPFDIDTLGAAITSLLGS